jgi:hypothetical protein
MRLLSIFDGRALNRGLVEITLVMAKCGEGVFFAKKHKKRAKRNTLLAL